MALNRCLFITTLLMLGMIQSCDPYTKELGTPGNFYFYVPRYCEYINVAQHTPKSFPPGYGIQFREKDCYLLISVSSDRAAPHDAGIEDNIQKFLALSGEEFGIDPMYIEYRIERCLSFTIKSSMPLLGRDAGEDLSDKFEFIMRREDMNLAHTATYRIDFIIDGDGNIDGIIETGMTIREYLGYEPMMLPYALLHLKETPPEVTEDEPLEVEFTVTVELEGGKTLSATTAVTLEK